MKIKDGQGSGRFAKVNARQRLDTTCANLSQAQLISMLDGRTFSWSSSFSAATGNEIIYIQNTSKTRDLIITEIHCGGVNTGLFELFEVTGTPAGTVITGKNNNLSSNFVAEATAYGNASVTGLTVGDRIGLVRTQAGEHKTLQLQSALILGFQDAIALTYTGSTGVTDCYLQGFYQRPEDI